jgi:FkbM family methyltransferase
MSAVGNLRAVVALGIFRSLRSGSRSVSLHVDQLGTGVLHLGSWFDLYVVWHVLGAGGYPLPDERVDTVVDVGAHIGIFALLAHARYPAARIHAVEPDAHNLALLRRNVNGVSGIVVHSVALSGHDGSVSWRSAKHGWSSRTATSSTDVAATSWPSLRDVVGGQIDLLKVDCEGGERHLLARPDGLDGIRHCLIELHMEHLSPELRANAPALAGRSVEVVEDFGHRRVLRCSPR